VHGAALAPGAGSRATVLLILLAASLLLLVVGVIWPTVLRRRHRLQASHREESLQQILGAAVPSAGSSARGACPVCGEPWEAAFEYCIYCAENAAQEADASPMTPGAGSSAGIPSAGSAGPSLPSPAVPPASAKRQASKMENRAADAVPAASLEATPIFREVHLLIVERDGVPAASFELDRERKYLIGSNPVADFVLQDGKVGPIQARLAFRDGTFHLRNLNPGVAMSIEGRAREQCSLHSNQRVRLGDSDLLFRTELRRVN
jgi:hypothetical protein